MCAYWRIGQGRGCDEEVAKLGRKPRTPSGHDQRHLDSVMNIDECLTETHAKLNIPLYARHSNARVVRAVEVLVVHE